ncbi:phosphoribosylanthranilate isomerase [Clostridium chromiireducens]|uniref:N-(5'-phosphoribosyl)anthranilate isomerase n=1 Tax=Clostridium chromiireducens TaxID=225345 RepID=A0A399IP65_9CLOT|nr:phosphoribosylanthranilate isomerase [Clostridium chromiireducens]RII33232.1 phosphoribosylanthranilate isomerase [Clostridium chromiireducens]
MIQVKICGITNKNEIEYLNILKPEYIGFVFTKSKRQVTSREAKELCDNLSNGIKTVGVFKDNTMEEILDVLNDIPLNAVQLHGNEDEVFIAKLKKNIDVETNIWKALSISDVDNIKRFIKFKDIKLIDNVLIDGDNPGSGEIYSLDSIGRLFDENCNVEQEINYINRKYNFFLAGGITPENVVERVSNANSIGVDVSSGVECMDEKGIRTKSFEKMKKLIDNVRKIKSI